jgi:hypothetical protein
MSTVCRLSECLFCQTPVSSDGSVPCVHLAGKPATTSEYCSLNHPRVGSSPLSTLVSFLTSEESSSQSPWHFLLVARESTVLVNGCCRAHVPSRTFLDADALKMSACIDADAHTDVDATVPALTRMHVLMQMPIHTLTRTLSYDFCCELSPHQGSHRCVALQLLRSGDSRFTSLHRIHSY